MKRAAASPLDSQPRKKRKSLTRTPSDSLDLSSIYKDCVKLGSMNKINQKNAWSLQLLDYIDNVLDVEERAEQASQGIQGTQNDSLCNFQVASNTLDASIKIYACRVDNVHNATYKVLGGLERSNKDKERGEDDTRDPRDDNNEQSKQRNKRRRVALGSTLEKNPTNLNMKRVDAAIRVDPLFHKTSAAFDEGGAKGLLLSQIGVSEGGNVVFDSSEYKKEDINFANVEHYDLSLFEELVDPLWDSYAICNDFVEFSFAWDHQASEHGRRTSQVPLAFNNNELDVSTQREENQQEYETFNHLADNLAHAYPDDDGDETVDLISKILGDAGAIIPDFDISNVIGEGTNEFEYFQKGLVQNWAGPEHWSFRKSRGPSSTAPRVAKKRQKREQQFIDFFTPEEIPACQFKKPRSREKTTLSLLVLEKSADTLLPPDVHYQLSSLTSLFTKPRKAVSFRKVDEILRDGSEKEETEEPMGNFPSMEDFDSSMPPPSPFGNHLVPEPDQAVARTQINYAKKATTVDIEKLKSSIWKELGTLGEMNRSAPHPKISNPVSFSALLEDLPSRIPSNQLEGVSVPLCFICLLDLANKKQLQIENSLSNDLTVSSYVSVACE